MAALPYIFRFFISLYLLSFSRQNQVTNLGDVRLFNVERVNQKEFEGEAQIYISSGNSAKNWSRICKTNSFNYEEAIVFCYQLGFSGGQIIGKDYIISDYPAMVSNFECGRSSHQHILQCEYTIDNYSCSDSVFIRCSNETDVTLTRNGQLKICAPDSHGDDSNIVSSVSFGILSINFDKIWKAIGNSSISIGASNLADLACYTMGFQKAVSGSVMTAKATEYSFSSCNRQYAYSSWLNLTDLNCDFTQQYPCFGCCLQYPYHQACSKQGCEEDFIVLQCIFDPFNEVISNPQNCTFKEQPSELEQINNYDGTCNLSHNECKDWQISFGIFLSSTIVLILFIIASLFLVFYTPIRKRLSYQQLNQPVGRE